MRNDIDVIWENDIYPAIIVEEKNYNKKLKIHIFCHIVLFILVVYLFQKFIVANLGVEPELRFYIACVVPNFIFFLFTDNMTKTYKNKLKEVYNIFLKPYGITHSFEHSNDYSIADITETKIFASDYGIFDDIFTGKLNDIPFEIAEIELRKSTGKHGHTVFHGSVIVIDNFLPVEDTIVLYKNASEQIMNNYSLDIREFISKLEQQEKYGGIIISRDKIFIFIRKYDDDYEVPTSNITKEAFEKVVNRVLSLVDILKSLEIKQKYTMRQDNSLTISNQKVEISKLVWCSFLVFFVLYLIFFFVSAFIFLIFNTHIMFEATFMFSAMFILLVLSFFITYKFIV